MTQSTRQLDDAARIAAGSIAVALAVLGLKAYAYVVTGSVALYSDACESVINVVAAAVAFAAVRLSTKPADSNHPYGHHKAEYFAAVLEGALIVVAALAIFREAWLVYVSPRAIDAPLVGLAINSVATVLNGFWAATLIRLGRRSRSPALVADGRHLVTDVVSSIGVVIGLGIATLTGWPSVDPAVAALVGIGILWSGWRLVSESVGGLMDQAPAPDEVERIRGIISAQADGAIEAHDLRTRHAGRMTFVDFHLVVPGDMRVAEAHVICDRIEQALRADVGDAVITIHVEPEEKAKHSGIVVL